MAGALSRWESQQGVRLEKDSSIQQGPGHTVGAQHTEVLPCLDSVQFGYEKSCIRYTSNLGGNGPMLNHGQMFSETAMTPLDAARLCLGRSQARECLCSLWFGIEFDEFHGACSSFNSLV